MQRIFVNIFFVATLVGLAAIARAAPLNPSMDPEIFSEGCWRCPATELNLATDFASTSNSDGLKDLCFPEPACTFGTGGGSLDEIYLRFSRPSI